MTDNEDIFHGRLDVERERMLDELLADLDELKITRRSDGRLEVVVGMGRQHAYYLQLSDESDGSAVVNAIAMRRASDAEMATNWPPVVETEPVCMCEHTAAVAHEPACSKHKES